MSTEKTLPLWSERKVKSIVRNKIIHEIKNLPNPRNLRGFHLPSSQLLCIRSFAEAGLDFSFFCGIEGNQRTYKEMRKNAKDLPTKLQRKIMLKHAQLKDMWNGTNPARHGIGIEQGFDIYYLDLMCHLRPYVRNIVHHIGDDPGSFRCAFQKGNPGLLYLTLGLRGDRYCPEERALLEWASKDHPLLAQGGTKEKAHRTLAAALHHYSRHMFEPMGRYPALTHVIFYQDITDSAAPMISLGMKVFPKAQQHKALDEPIPTPVFLGIEKYENNVESRRELAQWHHKEIFQEDQLPGLKTRKITMKGLRKLGYSPHDIACAYSHIGYPTSQEEAELLSH